MASDRKRQSTYGSLSDRQHAAQLARGTLETFVGYRMKRASMKITADFVTSLSDLELKPGSFSVLSTVVDNPDATQTAVAQHLGIERSNLVVIIDELEDRALIVRNNVPGDRRAYALRATVKGISLYTLAVEKIRHHEDRFLSALTQDEREMLLRLMSKI